MAVGIVGCFIHKIPGPLLAFAGILLLNYGAAEGAMSTTAIVLCAIAVIAAMLIGKYMLPKLGKLVAPSGKGGKCGCIIGSLIGILMLSALSGEGISFTGIIMFLLAPFVLAVLFETISKKNPSEGFKAGTGAYVVYLAGSMLKLAVCAYCLYTSFTLMD